MLDLERYRRMLDPQRPPVTYARLFEAIGELVDEVARLRSSGPEPK